MGEDGSVLVAIAIQQESARNRHEPEIGPVLQRGDQQGLCLAGLGLNLYEADSIYQNMAQHARYPENLFKGSPQTLAALRAGIGRSLGREQ